MFWQKNASERFQPEFREWPSRKGEKIAVIKPYSSYTTFMKCRKTNRFISLKFSILQILFLFIENRFFKMYLKILRYSAKEKYFSKVPLNQIWSRNLKFSSAYHLIHYLLSLCHNILTIFTRSLIFMGQKTENCKKCSNNISWE